MVYDPVILTYFILHRIISKKSAQILATFLNTSVLTAQLTTAVAMPPGCCLLGIFTNGVLLGATISSKYQTYNSK
jgi:hypothetical protein